MRKKKIYVIRVVAELTKTDGELVIYEHSKKFSAVDIKSLKQRLKVYRKSLRDDLEFRYPKALLQKMDFLLPDNSKILGKGSGSEKHDKKEKLHQTLRQQDRRIASGKFTTIEDQ